MTRFEATAARRDQARRSRAAARRADDGAGPLAPAILRAQARPEVSRLGIGFGLDPAFDEAYGRDMESMTGFLVASGRLRAPKRPLDYTFSDPVAAADPALVRVPGRWKA